MITASVMTELMCLLNECPKCVFYEEISKILVPNWHLQAKIETLKQGVKYVRS